MHLVHWPTGLKKKKHATREKIGGKITDIFKDIFQTSGYHFLQTPGSCSNKPGGFIVIPLDKQKAFTESPADQSCKAPGSCFSMKLDTGN